MPQASGPLSRRSKQSEAACVKATGMGWRWARCTVHAALHARRKGGVSAVGRAIYTGCFSVQSTVMGRRYSSPSANTPRAPLARSPVSHTDEQECDYSNITAF